MKRLICILTIFAILSISLSAGAENNDTSVTEGVSEENLNSESSNALQEVNGEESSEDAKEPTKRLEIDDFRDITTRNVNKIMSTGSYKITDVPSSSLKIPDMIPDNLTNKLENLLDDAPYSCAVYYIDLETGFEITYNADRWFGGASSIKAPFMMALLDKIERGKLSFDKEITYSYDRAGTVQISKDYDLGAKLSVRLLIEYLIYYSDNVAFSLLMNNACSLSEFRSYCKKNYGTDIYKDGLNQMNAIAPAKCLQDLYAKAKSGNEIYVWFVELLKQANENKFIRNGLPKDENGKYIYQVAHKYGMDINASNDMAIVYCGERPYALVVLTDYIGYNTQSFINKVSAAVYDIHKYIIEN